MNQLFKQTSVGDRGTMYHLKEIFQHRSLKSKVMDNVQHVWDFVEVC